MRRRRIVVYGALLTAAAGCTLPVAPPVVAPAMPGPTVEYVAAQHILSPLPLRVHLPERYQPVRVIAFYKTWGSEGWDRLELSRSGAAWTGAVSCREVSTITGPTRFAFAALDAKGIDVVKSDAQTWPEVETMVRYMPDGPEALPGARSEPPCPDPADCPPDFPGCPATPILRPACASDRDCGQRGVCAWDGYCEQAH
jgi:hypothetical protein